VATKILALRRDDICSSCSAPLPAGTAAQWDSAAKAVTCLSCVEQGAPPSEPASPVEPPSQNDVGTPTATTESPTIDIGVPGASARKEYERRRAKREHQIEEKWGAGRLGRFVKAISDDPQSTTAWSQGAKGEERVAEILHDRLGDHAVLLHDRKVPKTKGNIDHLAIASSGVWIIDAKRYKGKVERRDVGGFFRSDIRLYVGGRDRTKTLDNLGWQVDAVRQAIGDEAVPVHPSLSFVGAEWPLFFAKPFQLDGVWISWPAKLADLVLADGPVSPDDIEQVARRLAEHLPANRG
jgi:hypothetical protein